MQPWYECVHYFASLPLCIHGNRCPNGSATGKVKNIEELQQIDLRAEYAGRC